MPLSARSVVNVIPVLQPNVTQKIKIEKYESYPNVQSMVNDLFQNLAAK